MIILITTQYRENYGVHDWDGVGACPQYWKNKGGTDYKITGVKESDDHEEIVRLATDAIEYSNDASSENVIGWSLKWDDHVTADEELQIEYEGSIVYPAKKIAVEELLTPSL
jgi:hypothetical protein